MRKFLVHLSIAAIAALGVAGGASASSNVANGTVVTGTNVGGIALGSLITCNTSTVSGPITNLGAGLGANQSLTAATWGSCGFGNSATANNLPWTLSTTGGGPSVWTGQITGVDVTVKVFGGAATCRYAGTLSGGNYDNNGGGAGIGRLNLAGSLSFVSGSSTCPTSAQSVSGSYSTSPNLQLS